MRHLPTAFLIPWLLVGLALLAGSGRDRLATDAALRGLDAASRRAACWDRPADAALFRDLERLALKLKSATAPPTRRLLFATAPRSGGLLPLAHHLLYPIQVLETPREGRSRAELQAEAAARGAEQVLLLDANGAWLTLEATP